MATKTFVQVEMLTAVTYDGETAEERADWLANLDANGIADIGVTFANGMTGDYVFEDIDSTELTQTALEFFDFMGSEYEDERFYGRDINVYKHKQTGALYVQYTGEDMFEV